jgi:hypothetical protein
MKVVPRILSVLALVAVASLGAWLGVHLHVVLVPDALVVVLAVGGVLLTLLQFGSSQVAAHLNEAITALRSISSPKTDRLLEYALRKRRAHTRARLLAGALAIGPIGAAALLKLEVLRPPASMNTVNGTIAVVAASVGFASLALQLIASVVALVLWLDVETFEADVHAIVKSEKDRLKFVANNTEQAASLRELSEGVPVRFAESGDHSPLTETA